MQENIENWLVEWFGQKAPQVELGPDDNYFMAGVVDSFGVIILIEEMENEFSIKFVEQDFQDRRFATRNGLAEMVREKLAG